MARAPSFRVYFVTHHNGRLTGILLRSKHRLFDKPEPSAIGSNEEDVLRQLEAQVIALEATHEDTHDRYLWDEHFQVREITVEVHPQTAVKKRIVIGAREIPLRLHYAWAEIPNGGGYRILLPRFGWSFVVEKLAIAPEVLGNAISTAMLGENPRSIYEFRREGGEYLLEWSPKLLVRRDDESDDAREGRADRPTLRAVSEDLVEKASRGKLAPVVGDGVEFDPWKGYFARTPPPSILLVGPAGVGKSTWVRRLARHFLALKRAAGPEATTPGLYATSAERIIAGMVYLGMWQQRCLSLVNELSNEGDYLYVDRLLAFLRPQTDGASIGELFYAAVAAGEIALIAECTPAEYEFCQRKYPAFVSCFQVVHLNEPPAHRVTQLLADYQARKNPNVVLHPAALRRLVRYLGAFQRDLGFPGKGMRFLDWLNAGERAEASTAPPRDAGAPAKVLYPADISAAFSRQTGLPQELISDEHGQSAGDLATVLKRSVIGQDHACETVARVLARFKAGLNDPDRPCGTLLFVGPTGVGKTELAKTVARFMFGDPQRMIRLDMSEYMLPGAAQRLLWVGAGVTSLAQRVREQPLCLVLFDEIEKAHPEVFDLLLGVLGEGRMTDALGGHVDFRMAVIVMTSNLGAGEQSVAGFGAGSEASRASEGAGASGDGLRAVRRHFRPEFFNRIDHVVPFRALGPAEVLRIVDLELNAAGARTGMLRRNVRLEVTPDAKRALADVGFHPTRGARPLKRVIEERIVSPVAALLARDPALRDRTLRVSLAGDGGLAIE